MGLIIRLLILTLFLPSLAYAAGPTLGDVAGRLTGVASGVYLLLYKIFYVVGIAMLVGSLIRFKEHRDNPQQVPFSQPITLLLLGLGVIAIPVIAKLSEAVKTVQ